MTPYRPEFEAALRILAKVSTAMTARGFDPPVLVGGGAVEIQARELFALHRDADMAYMERRIRHESAGGLGIADLTPNSDSPR